MLRPSVLITRVSSSLSNSYSLAPSKVPVFEIHGKSAIEKKIRPESNGAHQMPTFRNNVFKLVSIDLEEQQHLLVYAGRRVTKST